MTPLNLDLDTLRTLVVAQELGGFAQAAERLGRTPSAISLQMKRLQEDAGAELFRKRGRGLALTEAGELTLACARRMLALNDELLGALQGEAAAGELRLGCPQDFAEAVLPDVLARFSRRHPKVRLELRIEGHGALAEAVAKGELDLALTLGQAERPEAEPLGEMALGWIAAEGFRPPEGEPLPLLLLGPQCRFRREALAHLEAAGRPWRLAALSPSLAGLWASAQGGLGVTARTALGLPPTLRWGRTLLGLPVLGALPLALHRGRATGPAATHLHGLLREAALRALELPA